MASFGEAMDAAMGITAFTNMRMARNQNTSDNFLNGNPKYAILGKSLATVSKVE